MTTEYQKDTSLAGAFSPIVTGEILCKSQYFMSPPPPLNPKPPLPYF